MGKTLSYFSCKVKKSNTKSKKNGSNIMKSLEKSAKSTPSSKGRIFKSAQKTVTTQVLPLSPHIVEFEIDGNRERLGVFEALSIIEKSASSEEMFTPVNGKNIQTPFKGSIKGKGRRSKSVKKLGVKNRHFIELDQPGAPEHQNVCPNQSLSSISQEHFIPVEMVLNEAEYRILQDYRITDAPERPASYIQHLERSVEDTTEEVEYDLDEVDCAWLQILNEERRKRKLVEIDPNIMEFIMDRFEKEAYLQMQNTGMNHSPLIDDDAECCVCLDGECQNSNVILFCDMCNLAVHQECYGVPYIPEGQWLCRRCLQRPDSSGSGDCELCPNKGGAFKQTHDGKWAHVVCAIWIPEVCFANTVFLEPVDGITNIPSARWKLVCFICKQKGIGACIQCHKSSCYKAFHVTCAQQANLVMTIDTVRQNSSIVVKKTVWCDNHAPSGSERKRKDMDDSSSSRQKLKETRKVLAEKRVAIPTVTIPNIPPERAAELAIHIKLAGKRFFLKRLMAYWKLKRQSRNGVPLLRRLQISSLRSSPNIKEAQQQIQKPNPTTENTDVSDVVIPSNPHRDWLKIRQDLERVRLLSELVRKREQLKLMDIRTKEKISDLTLRPFNIFLKGIVDEIIKRDTHQIFVEPVDTNIVKSYLAIISHPMDLGTMKEKIDSYDYSSIDELEQDFNLMINNCIKFNDKDTIYYKSATKLRAVGEVIISQGRQKAKSIDFDPKIGMHVPQPQFLSDI